MHKLLSIIIALTLCAPAFSALVLQSNDEVPLHQNFPPGANQHWEKTDSPTINGNYSPLFIDLNDDYNQRTDGIVYNNDLISGIPHNMMSTMVSGMQTWPQLRTRLFDYVGIYFTYPEYTEFAAPYDYYDNNL